MLSSMTRKKPNSFYLTETVIVNKPVNNVFNFILKDLQTCYTKIAKGHEKFKVENAEKISEGKFIECSETIKNVKVSHRYEVKKVIKNKHIYFCTELPNNPTKVLMQFGKKIVENVSGSHVYYDFKDINSKQTQMTVTIVIQLPNLLNKIMGTITGSKKLFSNHLIEETNGLKREIESAS